MSLLIDFVDYQLLVLAVVVFEITELLLNNIFLGKITIKRFNFLPSIHAFN